MNSAKPNGVTTQHLGGVAAIYVRQSSERQTIENTGSLEYQRGQTKWPSQWGWPDSVARKLTQ